MCTEHFVVDLWQTHSCCETKQIYLAGRGYVILLELFGCGMKFILVYVCILLCRDIMLEIRYRNMNMVCEAYHVLFYGKQITSENNMKAENINTTGNQFLKLQMPHPRTQTKKKLITGSSIVEWYRSGV